MTDCVNIIYKIAIVSGCSWWWNVLAACRRVHALSQWPASSRSSAHRFLSPAVGHHARIGNKCHLPRQCIQCDVCNYLQKRDYCHHRAYFCTILGWAWLPYGFLYPKSFLSLVPTALDIHLDGQLLPQLDEYYPRRSVFHGYGAVWSQRTGSEATSLEIDVFV